MSSGIHFGAVIPELLNHDLTKVKPAKEYRPDWYNKQKTDNPSENKFARCPGMFDYMNHGYVIPAWTNFHIEATPDSINYAEEGGPRYVKVSPMNPALLNGVTTQSTGKVPFRILKVPVPWFVSTDPGWSILLVPPFYHTPQLQHFNMYPGVIDTDAFVIVNFVFSPRYPVKVDIKIGEPLLQVIPYRREDEKATVGLVTERQQELRDWFDRDVKSFYRKFCHEKKTFT